MTDVYIESGAKRTLAVSIDWPGWSRGGKDETSALQALLQAAPRYAEIVADTGLGFGAPESLAELTVREQVAGSAATGMGVPEVVLTRDEAPMDEAERARAEAVLRACWAAFDRAVAQARGKELRKGPRGGGRELEAIQRHVAEAEASYTERVGLKVAWEAVSKAESAAQALAASREGVLAGLAAVAPIGVPPPGPRGGKRWPARYFVRRVAYHVVDHLWEIEDRSTPE